MLKPEQLAAIEARRERFYSSIGNPEWACVKILIGTDIPALLAHIREQEKIISEHDQNMADMIARLQASEARFAHLKEQDLRWESLAFERQQIIDELEEKIDAFETGRY